LEIVSIERFAQFLFIQVVPVFVVFQFLLCRHCVSSVPLLYEPTNPDKNNLRKIIGKKFDTMVFALVACRSTFAVVSRQSQCSVNGIMAAVRLASATAEVIVTTTAIQQSMKRPVRNAGITLAERAALRAARKERATKFMANQQHQQGGGHATNGGSSGRATSTNLATSHYIWYLGVGIPTGLLVWGLNDENSPPAQFCRITGITGFIRSYTDEISKPVYDKLLPDWSQVNGEIVFFCFECGSTFYALFHLIRSLFFYTYTLRCRMSHMIFRFHIRWSSI
jgi:hypothetical protein